MSFKPLFNETQAQEMAGRNARGESIGSIARSFGVKTDTISRTLRRHGFTPIPQRQRCFSDQQEREIAAIYQMGTSMSQLARQYGCTITTIRKALIRTGTSIRRRGGLCKLSSEQEFAVVRSYEAGDSQAKIARRYGVGQPLISRVLRQKGIRTDSCSGPRHGRWKGGRTRTGEGYVLIRLPPDSPYASMRSQAGYVPEHRLVMAQHIGRPLRRGETVHHLNGDRADNRLENLELRQGRHGKGWAFKCADCGSLNIVPINDS